MGLYCYNHAILEPDTVSHGNQFSFACGASGANWFLRCAAATIQLLVACLVFPISDAGRIVAVAIRVTNLTIAPMDNNFRMFSLGNRYSVIDCRVLRAVSAG